MVECQGSKICTAPATGFVNELGEGCDSYTELLFEYCISDVHMGLDGSLANKTACEVCPVCQSAPICNAPDTGFVG